MNEVKEYNLWKGLPAETPDVYHQGLNHDGPRRDPVYGRRRIVERLARDGLTRQQAEASLRKAGVVYEELFPTARYWCAAVYE